MKLYKICKNWHYCLNFFPVFHFRKYWGADNTKTFRIDKNFEVCSGEEHAVNKLFGQCYGLLGVHRESDRFGWNYDPMTGNVRIYSYSYNKGILHKQAVWVTTKGSDITLSIITAFNCNSRKVYFYVNDTLVNTEVYYCSSLPKLVVELGPYFGGNLPAPKGIELLVTK